MLPARWLTIFGACLCLVTAEANSAESNSPEEERAQPPTFISAVQESIRLQEQIDEYRVRLIEIESLGGPYDTRLSEILQGLTNVLVEVRSFDEVDKILARRQLIIRTNEGPASLSQLPVVEQAIANDIRRGDWEAVTERYEFIFWLRSQNIDTNPVAQFEARNDLIDWHLTAVYLDRPNRRVRHLMQARLLDRQNLGDTQDHYGEDSPQLIPYLYRHARLQHQITSFLNAKDELGFDAREEFTMFVGKSPRDFRREGLNSIGAIKEILESEGTDEALAMALIYEGDFLKLYGQGFAPRAYREAKEKLAEAGISQRDIDRFFARPNPLPEPKFHQRFEAALAAQDDRGFNPAPGPEGNTDLGIFLAWNESLPYRRRPEPPPTASDAADIVELHEIVMEFSLNSQGKTSNPRIVESSTDNSRVRREARDAVMAMRFRPRFEEGRGRRMENLRITYQVPPQL